MSTPRGRLLHEPVGGAASTASSRPVPRLGPFEHKRLAVKVQYERSRAQSLVLALPTVDNTNPANAMEQEDRNGTLQQQQQQQKPSRVLVSYEEDNESIDYVPFAKTQAPLTKINVDLMLVRGMIGKERHQ